MMNYAYFLSKINHPSLYTLVLLTSFLSIFNKFERKKKPLRREDSQMKEEDIKNNTTYFYETINCVGVLSKQD
jgi:hypothetical protein